MTFGTLDEFLKLTADKEALGLEYIVAWIDCLSGKNARGILYAGKHAASGELAGKAKTGNGPRVPFALPEFVLNSFSVKVFNSLYYAANARKKGTQTVDYDPFFYPLDSVRDWNLIYGKGGLLQYQCVIPENESAAFQEVLTTIADAGAGSFLGVVKKFGDVPSPGMMSFPRPGLTLALDFPFRGEGTLRLLEKLDHIVLEAHGALYPAKDGRMNRTMFEASYPHLDRFRAFVDPQISSSFWRRVQG
jgi:hypothetical protein